MDQADQFEFLARVSEDFIPFNHHMGLKVDHVEKGRCVLRLPWKDIFVGDPVRRVVHGGVISMLIDVTGGTACFSMLSNPNDRCSTVDLRVDYLRPGPPADLVCEGRVVRMGNRVAVTRMEVFSGQIPAPGTAESATPIAYGQAVYNIARRSGKEESGSSGPS